MRTPRSTEKRRRRRLRVVVFGGGSCREGGRSWLLAHEVGKVVASHGLVLVSGGYGGAMEAASRGARAAGGVVYGVTAAAFADRTPNRYLNKEVRVPDYLTRLTALLRMGDAFVALPGALGTVAEWVTAWSAIANGQLRAPLWVFADPWRAITKAILALREVKALRLTPRQKEAGLLWVQDVEGLRAGMGEWLTHCGRRRPAGDSGR